nr:IS256 family transposase [uncultured Trichococcus sp.]
MTQLNININMEELTEAVLSSNINSMMKSMAVLVFNAYMEAERDEHIQASQYERNVSRTDYRNGYYERDFTLSIGRLTLKVPRTRSGEFSTQLFERYKRMDQALVLSMVEAVVNGVSTKKVSKIVEQLCGETVSKSFVSNAMKHLDPEIEEFRTRSLTSHTYRYLYVDAMYIKVRENHRIISKAVYVAQGVNELNKREIVGFKVSGQESTEIWKSFLQELRDRGLTQPNLVISDAHAGLKAAIQEVFVGSAWQRCTVHFLRNILEGMPKKECVEQREALRKIFRANTLQQALESRQAFEELTGGEKRFSKALDTLDSGFMDAMQYLQEPEAYHISLRTTNSLERVNREIGRREKVVSIFPNTESAERLIGAVLMDMNEEWAKNTGTFLMKKGNPIVGRT